MVYPVLLDGEAIGDQADVPRAVQMLVHVDVAAADLSPASQFQFNGQSDLARRAIDRPPGICFRIIRLEQAGRFDPSRSDIQDYPY